MQYRNRNFNELINEIKIGSENDVVTDRNLDFTTENYRTELDVVAENNETENNVTTENYAREEDIVLENNVTEKNVATENYEREEDVTAEKKVAEKKLKRKKSTLKSQAKRYIIDFCRGNDFQELFDWIYENLVNYEKSKSEYLADKRNESEKNYDAHRDAEITMRENLNIIHNGNVWVERRCSDES